MLINFLKTLHLQILHYTMTVWLFFNSLIIMWNGKHLRGLSGSLFDDLFRWQVISSSWLWNLSRNKKKSERKKPSAREVILLVRRATSEGKSYRVRSRFLLALVSLRKLREYDTRKCECSRNASTFLDVNFAHETNVCQFSHIRK